MNINNIFRVDVSVIEYSYELDSFWVHPALVKILKHGLVVFPVIVVRSLFAIAAVGKGLLLKFSNRSNKLQERSLSQDL